MSFMSKKVGMISLGCPKNQVDGEIMLSKLADNGFEITNDVDGADVVIVNTCGFIEDAKKEAIENILDVQTDVEPRAACFTDHQRVFGWILRRSRKAYEKDTQHL